MVLMSIDDELLAQNEPDQYFVHRTQDRPKPGSSEWLFQRVLPAQVRDERDQPDEAYTLKSTWHEFPPSIVKELDDGEAKLLEKARRGEDGETLQIRIETATLNKSCKEHLVGQHDPRTITIDVAYDKNVFWVLVDGQTRRRGEYKLWKKERGNQQLYLYKDGDQPYMCHLTPKVQLNSKLDSKAYSRYMNCPTHFDRRAKSTAPRMAANS